MGIKVDNIEWSSNAKIFSVSCYGRDYIKYEVEIFGWLHRMFDEPYSSDNRRWTWQLYQNQNEYIMFGVTFLNEEDALAFKLRWT